VVRAADRCDALLVADQREQPVERLVGDIALEVDGGP
jgi:hypothetical protein